MAGSGGRPGPSRPWLRGDLCLSCQATLFPQGANSAQAASRPRARVLPPAEPVFLGSVLPSPAGGRETAQPHPPVPHPPGLTGWGLPSPICLICETKGSSWPLRTALVSQGAAEQCLPSPSPSPEPPPNLSVQGSDENCPPRPWEWWLLGQGWGGRCWAGRLPSRESPCRPSACSAGHLIAP